MTGGHCKIKLLIVCDSLRDIYRAIRVHLPVVYFTFRLDVCDRGLSKHHEQIEGFLSELKGGCRKSDSCWYNKGSKNP